MAFILTRRLECARRGQDKPDTLSHKLIWYSEPRCSALTRSKKSYRALRTHDSPRFKPDGLKQTTGYGNGKSFCSYTYAPGYFGYQRESDPTFVSPTVNNNATPSAVPKSVPLHHRTGSVNEILRMFGEGKCQRPHVLTRR